MSESDVAAGHAAAVAAELASAAAGGLEDPDVSVTWDLRYAGQAFELPVPAPAEAGIADLRARFEQAHAERYGYADPEGTLELVNLRVTATARRAALAEEPAEAPGPPARTTRVADFDGEQVEIEVLAGPPGAGERVPGPAVLELAEATAVVPPGWVAASDEHGAVLLDREAEG